jgi:hypothetical protein
LTDFGCRRARKDGQDLTVHLIRPPRIQAVTYHGGHFDGVMSSDAADKRCSLVTDGIVEGEVEWVIELLMLW